MKFDTGKFEFPEPISRPSIEKFLERRDSKLAVEGLPPKTQKTAGFNVRKALCDLKRQGLDPAKEAISESHQEVLYKVCAENGITVVSIGHRESIRPFHKNILTLDGLGGWSLLRT